MYFPLTSTVEEVWQNDVFRAPRPWNKGGGVAVDVKTWTGEIVIQGQFISIDGNVDSDYETDIRTLMSIASPTVISPQEQHNFLLEKLLTTNNFVLFYNGNEYGFASGSVDISAGEYPPVVVLEYRAIGEGNKDILNFTFRCVIAQASLPRS